MLASYFTLGLKPGVSDEKIRERYLSLIKIHTPEKDPAGFQEIAAAYEKIKTRRSRVLAKLFHLSSNDNFEEKAGSMINASKVKRQNVCLNELISNLKNS